MKKTAFQRTKMTLFAALVVTLVYPLTTVTAQGPASGSAPAGDPKKGEEYYLAYSCYACHGYGGETGGGTRLVPMRLTVEGFMAYLRNPPRPQQMPPYTAKTVPDQQVADIHAYLRTLPISPEPQDIPLLDELLNEQ